jgi:hypothetical protein
MLDDKIAEYIGVISKAAMKAGPQVMQFAIQHEHWCGIGDISIGLFFLVMTFVFLFLLKKNWISMIRQDEYAEISVAIGIGSAIGATCCLIVACIQLLNIWNWVAVFNPKIALFHDILTKFLSK